MRSERSRRQSPAQLLLQTCPVQLPTHLLLPKHSGHPLHGPAPCPQAHLVAQSLALRAHQVPHGGGGGGDGGDGGYGGDGGGGGDDGGSGSVHLEENLAS